MTDPPPAVILVGLLIAALALIGDVHVTWSFTAFTVLIYRPPRPAGPG